MCRWLGPSYGLSEVTLLLGNKVKAAPVDTADYRLDFRTSAVPNAGTDATGRRGHSLTKQSSIGRKCFARSYMQY